MECVGKECWAALGISGLDVSSQVKSLDDKDEWRLWQSKYKQKECDGTAGGLSTEDA